MLDLVWKYQLPEECVSNGAFVSLLGDRLVWQAFGQGLHAISTDGTAVWHRPSDSSTAFFGWKDRLYIGGERAECLDVTTGGVIAVRDSHLPVRVTAPTAEYARYWERTDSSRRETMLGLSLEDLSLLWAVPAPSGGVKWIEHWYYEYDQSTSEVTVRRPPSPEPLGQFHVDASLWQFHPVMADDVLIFRTPDFVHAIDAFDGRTLWRRTRTEGFGLERVVDGTFYLFSHTMCAIETRTGRELWCVETEAPVDDLAVFSDRLWLSTRNGRLRTVDRQTARPLAPPVDMRLDGFVIKMWALTAEDLILLTAHPGTNSEALWRIGHRPGS